MFFINELSILMSALLGLIGISVGKYAWNYLKGDHRRRLFFLKYAGLLVCLGGVFTLNPLWGFWVSWCGMNFFTTSLMKHYDRWDAARISARIARVILAGGCVALGGAFWIMSHYAGIHTISALSQALPSKMMLYPVFLIILTAVTQCALFPFQGWLVNSLNSPTPVSAIMHAGVINGGGYLLVRFSPLFIANPQTFKIIFILGFVSTVLGSIWKLMQPDVKRMLAFSTMAQMGYTIMQCGLGLFLFALTHLCWHALYKSYLFLLANGAVHEKRYDKMVAFRVGKLPLMIISGLVSVSVFASITHIPLFIDTRSFILLGVLLSGFQIALSFSEKFSVRNSVEALGLAGLFGVIYGCSIRGIEMLMRDEYQNKVLPLNHFYLPFLIALSVIWLGFLLKKSIRLNVFKKLYVYFLNASQPYNHCLTTHRKQHNFK